jgi:hypothetical protein
MPFTTWRDANAAATPRRYWSGARESGEAHATTTRAPPLASPTTPFPALASSSTTLWKCAICRGEWTLGARDVPATRCPRCNVPDDAGGEDARGGGGATRKRKRAREDDDEEAEVDR